MYFRVSFKNLTFGGSTSARQKEKIKKIYGYKKELTNKGAKEFFSF